MAKEGYLHPKAKSSDMGDRKKTNGMFQNIPSFPQFGGFSSAQRVPKPDRPLGLEKGELTRKGKPI